MKGLQYPHLPERQAALCAVSGAHSYICETLVEQGIEVLPVPASVSLAAPVNTHADMLLHPLPDGSVLVARGRYTLPELLRERGITVLETEQELQSAYPQDIGLNCFALKDVLYCNTKGADPVLQAYYKEKGYTVEHVSQGYAKCSTCLVDGNSAITADTAIYKALRRHGASCLLIRQGHICLPGYDTGFIGGCGGLVAPDCLAFAGDIHTHPDGAEIIDFCKSKGVEAVSLADGPLTDIGGIIPLLLE